MNNSIKMTETDAPEQEKYPNRYRKGQSGNPGGRPKKTAAELKAIERMKELTPAAVSVVENILRNKKASLYARLQAAEIIFNRAMGRPETYLKVDNTEQSVQASVARLQALFSTDDDEEESSDVVKDESDSAEDLEENAFIEEVNADAG